MDLLVVGAGAMGRWVARTVEADVAFADVDPAAAESAAAAVGGRTVDVAASPAPGDAESADGGEDGSRRPAVDGPTFDAVCVAVPLSAAAEAVAAYSPLAGRAMFDVSGTMADPVAAMRDQLPDRERVSLHPLFAPENAPGNVAAVSDAPGPVTDAVLDDLRAAGNHVFDTTPAEHDEAMETVQASAHAAVLAYALAADDVREEFATPVSSGLTDLVDTVTDGSPRVYREIQEAFPGSDRVAEAARRVADADAEEFESLYREAGE